MQKCNKLFPQDFKSVHKIMDCLLKSSKITTITPTLIEFNVFFNSIPQSDSFKLSIKYFEIMINEYKINPDVLTFASLLKSFRKRRSSKIC